MPPFLFEIVNRLGLFLIDPFTKEDAMQLPDRHPLDRYESARRNDLMDESRGLNLTGAAISIAVSLGLWWLVLRVILWVVS